MVDEMGIVADEETAVEVRADGSHVVGDVLIKPEEISGRLVAIVQLDNGITQVRFHGSLNTPVVDSRL